MAHATASDAQLITRLRRAEGQVRGVARMIEADRPCIEVITQICAVRGALDEVALTLLGAHSQRHAASPAEAADGAEAVAALARLIRRG